jgi:hypothetical protein
VPSALLHRLSRTHSAFPCREWYTPYERKGALLWRSPSYESARFQSPPGSPAKDIAPGGEPAASVNNRGQVITRAHTFPQEKLSPFASYPLYRGTEGVAQRPVLSCNSFPRNNGPGIENRRGFFWHSDRQSIASPDTNLQTTSSGETSDVVFSQLPSIASLDSSASPFKDRSLFIPYGSFDSGRKARAEASSVGSTGGLTSLPSVAQGLSGRELRQYLRNADAELREATCGRATSLPGGDHHKVADTEGLGAALDFEQLDSGRGGRPAPHSEQQASGRADESNRIEISPTGMRPGIGIRTESLLEPSEERGHLTGFEPRRVWDLNESPLYEAVSSEQVPASFGMPFPGTSNPRAESEAPFGVVSRTSAQAHEPAPALANFPPTRPEPYSAYPVHEPLQWHAPFPGRFDVAARFEKAWSPPPEFWQYDSAVSHSATGFQSGPVLLPVNTDARQYPGRFFSPGVPYQRPESVTRVPRQGGVAEPGEFQRQAAALPCSEGEPRPTRRAKRKSHAPREGEAAHQDCNLVLLICFGGTTRTLF